MNHQWKKLSFLQGDILILPPKEVPKVRTQVIRDLLPKNLLIYNMNKKNHNFRN
jgi:hypothetical protein